MKIHTIIGGVNGLDTADESKRRIANRVARGGHNIASEAVERRFLGRWKAVRVVPPTATKRPSTTTTAAL